MPFLGHKTASNISITCFPFGPLVAFALFVGRRERHPIYKNMLQLSQKFSFVEPAPCFSPSTSSLTQLLFVSDIAIFVLKRDVKLQLTN